MDNQVAAETLERIALANSSDPATDDLTVPLAIELAEMQDRYNCNTAIMHARTKLMNQYRDERDALRKALEIARERFANISRGRCPAPPGTANDPVYFREWAMAYADAGFRDVSATLSTSESGGGA